MKSVNIQRDLRQERREAADRFRRAMADQGTLVVRLMSSPGSGKTTLLQRTTERLAPGQRVAILVGDVETARDAERLAPYAPTRQITTGGACHLELPLVEDSLQKLAAGRVDYLFLEDIGNLICPASHDLGEHLRVLLLSTTEGDDKPGKYPKAFRTSDVVVISKTDLLPHVPFEVQRAEADARCVRDDLVFFQLSALRGEGVDAWVQFLRDRRDALRARSSCGPVSDLQ